MSKLKPILLILAFFLALAPVAADYAVHHSDEQFYAGAAIQMMQNNDYLTPRDEHGGLRFQKPIVAYWVTTASYHTLGVGVFSSRLPFLLAGCCVLGMVYATGRMLMGDRQGGVWALLIAMSHPQLALASIRSMTDILLTLGILISAFGFLAIIVKDRRSFKYYLAAYGGVGLGMASKGMLPIVFVVFIFAFVLLDWKRRVRLRALINVPAMLFGLTIGLGWYATMLALHGQIVLDVFTSDQITSSSPISYGKVAWQIPMLAGSFFVSFVCWSVPAVRLLITDPQSRSADDAPLRQAQRFIITWSALLAVVFGFAIGLEEHYILPAIPLVAIGLASILHAGQPRMTQRFLRQVLVMFAGVLAVFAVIAIGLFIQMNPAWPIAGALLAVLALCAILTAGGLYGRWLQPATGLALALLLLVPAVFFAMVLSVRSVKLPEHGEQLAQSLRKAGLDDGRDVLMVGKFGTAGKLRVFTNGRVPVHRLERFDPAVTTKYKIVIVSDRDVRKIDAEAFEVHSGSQGLQSLNITGLIKAFLTGRLRPFLKAKRNEYFIAVGKPKVVP